MNRYELSKIFEDVTRFYPNFDMSPSAEQNWLSTLGNNTYADVEREVRGYLNQYPTPTWPPTPGEVARRIRTYGATFGDQDDEWTARYLESQDQQGTLRLSQKNFGQRIHRRELKRDCLEVGKYTVGGKTFPLGYPKIEAIMDHFTGQFVTDAIKERLNISSPNEMLGSRKAELLPKYRELIEELVKLSNTEVVWRTNIPA
jgi:hypothetical protein